MNEQSIVGRFLLVLFCVTVVALYMETANADESVDEQTAREWYEDKYDFLPYDEMRAMATCVSDRVTQWYMVAPIEQIKNPPPFMERVYAEEKFCLSLINQIGAEKALIAFENNQ